MQETIRQRLKLKTNLLGQILIKQGLITPNQLDEILAVQKKEGGLLGDLLIKKGHLTEELICSALASQTSLCYIPLDQYEVPKTMIKFVPEEIVRKYLCLPIEMIEGVLTLVINNPFDDKVINEVSRVSGLKIVCALSTRSQIEKAISKYYAKV